MQFPGFAPGEQPLQVLVHASPPRLARIFDRLQTLVQFTVLQVILLPDGISTAGIFPPLQHPTSTQTSSNPSLEVVPGGFAQRLPSVVRGRQVGWLRLMKLLKIAIAATRIVAFGDIVLGSLDTQGNCVRERGDILLPNTAGLGISLEQRSTGS
jgi:hypothetical protein